MEKSLSQVNNPLVSLTAKDGRNVALRWDNSLVEKGFNAVKSANISDERANAFLCFCDRVSKRRTVVGLAMIAGLTIIGTALVVTRPEKRKDKA